MLPYPQLTVYVHRNLTIKPFLKQSNSRHDWKKDIERQFRFYGIQDPIAKKDGLLIYGGEELVSTMPFQIPPAKMGTMSINSCKEDRQPLHAEKKNPKTWPDFNSANSTKTQANDWQTTTQGSER